ncbi:hypothetical protein PSM7751_04015 [Pseudooceanicola marinus]|uniref:Uncharacterized protein n=1 Tax=Pseudooceanicola marinus TaxID=396013 RepID=A0A1X7A9C1_9RHOB|nr:hypothetical protein CVM50_00710 [Pseudooceanicola marinus]SLN73214.1 hypothetical protein PSM7751_04015 [Pseudooceanicola marinus]
MLRYALILAALPATAQEAPMPPLKAIECYCTDRQGDRVELGEVICLSVDGRSYLAQCQMSLNVPMWREVGPSCLSSRAAAPQRGASPPSAGD